MIILTRRVFSDCAVLAEVQDHTGQIGVGDFNEYWIEHYIPRLDCVRLHADGGSVACWIGRLVALRKMYCDFKRQVNYARAFLEVVPVTWIERCLANEFLGHPFLPQQLSKAPDFVHFLGGKPSEVVNLPPRKLQFASTDALFNRFPEVRNASGDVFNRVEVLMVTSRANHVLLDRVNQNQLTQPRPEVFGNGVHRF